MKFKFIIILFLVTINVYSQKLGYNEFMELTKTLFELKEVRNTLCNPDINHELLLTIGTTADASNIFIIFNNDSICNECNATKIISTKHGDLIFLDLEMVFFYDFSCYLNPVNLKIQDKEVNYKFIIPASSDIQDRKAKLFEVHLIRTKKEWKIKRVKSEPCEEYNYKF